MKVLITGSSGVGKSTVIAELAKRGFTAVDGDEEPDLSRLEVTATGEPTDWPDKFVDWSYNSWNFNEQILKKVLARNETVFLGAFNGNQTEYYNLFDRLIVLTVDPEEHLRRMLSRPRQSVNDGPENVTERVKKYPILLQRLLDSGAIPVDSSSTPDKTVDAILKVIGYAR